MGGVIERKVCTCAGSISNLTDIQSTQDNDQFYDLSVFHWFKLPIPIFSFAIKESTLFHDVSFDISFSFSFYFYFNINADFDPEDIENHFALPYGVFFSNNIYPINYFQRCEFLHSSYFLFFISIIISSQGLWSIYRLVEFSARHQQTTYHLFVNVTCWGGKGDREEEHNEKQKKKRRGRIIHPHLHLHPHLQFLSLSIGLYFP